MRFSILRLLIVTGLVALWFGAGRLYMTIQAMNPHVGDVTRLEAFTFGPLVIVCGLLITAIACFLIGSAGVGVWVLTGKIESEVRGLFRSEAQP